MPRILARAGLCVAALALAGAGCGSSTPTATTPTGIVTNAFIENFVGTLTPSTTGFYAFVVAPGNHVTLTLASLTNASDGSIQTAPMKLGLGVPAGFGCAVGTSVTTTAGLVAQLVEDVPQGTYCAAITDTAGLAANANFAIRITQGTLTLASKTSPEKFETRLGPTGSITQSLVAPTAGTVTATLDSVTPSATLGIGIGLWQFERASCRITQTTTGGPGTQISLPVDVGVYCVRVFDPATLADFVGFSVTIIHP